MHIKDAPTSWLTNRPTLFARACIRRSSSMDSIVELKVDVPCSSNGQLFEAQRWLEWQNRLD